MANRYTNKTQAINDVMRETGYGRYIIERKMEELTDAGSIAIVNDPGDQRKKLISHAHVKRIIAALTLSDADEPAAPLSEAATEE
jgi:hypothetical protein